MNNDNFQLERVQIKVRMMQVVKGVLAMLVLGLASMAATAGFRAEMSIEELTAEVARQMDACRAQDHREISPYWLEYDKDMAPHCVAVERIACEALKAGVAHNNITLAILNNPVQPEEVVDAFVSCGVSRQEALAAVQWAQQTIGKRLSSLEVLEVDTTPTSFINDGGGVSVSKN